MSEVQTQAIELLTTLVEDERKCVTYRWLSRSLNINVNVAKEAMQLFLDSHKGKAHGTYYLSGSSGSNEDGATLTSISLTNQEDLEAAKKKLTVIQSCHVYSVEPATLKDRALLSPSNAEAVQLGQGKDINMFRSVQNPNITILPKGTPRPAYATTISTKTIPASVPAASKVAQAIVPSAAVKPSMFAKQSASKSTQDSSLPHGVTPSTTSNGASESPSANASATASTTPAKPKSAMMSFFGKQATSSSTTSSPPSTTTTTATIAAKAPAPKKGTLNFKPAPKPDNVPRAKESSEEDEVDSEEERDRRLALNSRLDPAHREKLAEVVTPIEESRKKRRIAKMLAVDEDDEMEDSSNKMRKRKSGSEYEDDEEEEAEAESLRKLSKEEKEKLEREKDAQRLALENMMLVDDESVIERKVDPESMQVDIESVDQEDAASTSEVAASANSRTQTNSDGTVVCRRRGVRPVTKKVTFRNERGYMVTKDVVEMEAYSEDEVVAPVKPTVVVAAKPEKKASATGGAAPAPAGGAKKKTGGAGNQSLLNFFGKK